LWSPDHELALGSIQFQVNQLSPPLTAFTFPTQTISILPLPSTVTVAASPDYSGLYALIILAVIVVGVIGFLAYYRPRHAKSGTGGPAKVFCAECGKENPSTNQYCGKCGKPLVAKAHE
jgi:hypothetical protein